MTRKLSFMLAFALAAAIMALPAGAAPADVKFFLRSDSAAACADQVLTLATRAGSDESVCGYRNGAAFGEVYQQTALGDGTKFFSGSEGSP